jgi:hypothetical protein
LISISFNGIDTSALITSIRQFRSPSGRRPGSVGRAGTGLSSADQVDTNSSGSSKLRQLIPGAVTAMMAHRTAPL